jgi:hypothetical protein
MRSRLVVGLAGAALSLMVANAALAGMAAPTLEDVPRVLSLSNMAKLRIDAISFFLVCLLAIAWAIQCVWNSLVKDFPKLPRISYLRSLGLMGLWGLLFLLVLTMISGARELMTPGAWKKSGWTYELREPDSQLAPRSASSSENATEHR